MWHIGNNDRNKKNTQSKNTGSPVNYVVLEGDKVRVSNIKSIIIVAWLFNRNRLWHMSPSINYDIIGSDDGLPHICVQALFWNNESIQLINSPGSDFSEIKIQIQSFSYVTINVKMPSMLSRRLSSGFSMLIHVCDVYFFVWNHQSEILTCAVIRMSTGKKQSIQTCCWLGSLKRWTVINIPVMNQPSSKEGDREFGCFVQFYRNRYWQPIWKILIAENDKIIITLSWHKI